MMKKQVQVAMAALLCIVVLMLGAVLTEYRQKDREIQGTDDRRELVVLSNYQEKTCQEALTSLAEDYMEQHEEIRVKLKFVSPLDFQKELCLEKDNSSLADLIICDNMMTPVMNSMEILRDLSDWYTPQRVDTVNQTAYLSTLVNGSSYSAPFTSDPYVVFYNKNYYEKNNISPAKTMEEFVRQLREVRTMGNYNLAFAGKDDGDLAAFFLQMIYLYGGTSLDLDGTNSREFFSVLETLRDARVMPREMVGWNQQDLMGSFQKGLVVNVLAKLSSMSMLPEEEMNFSYGIMELPSANNQACLLHGESVSVTVESGEGAMELLEFLTSEESSRRFCGETNKMSVHEGVENCPGEDHGLEADFFKKQRYGGMKKNSYSSWFLISSAIEEGLTEFLNSTTQTGDEAAALMQEAVRAAIMER